MTEHRHLKQRVRERMARTGETYSTARRHLLARTERDRLPDGLVPGYDVFGPGPHRASSLVARLLRQAGHLAPHTGQPFTDAMVCGLGGGIGFMYAIFEYAKIPPLITIVAQHHPRPWLPAVLDRLGIGFDEGHSASTQRAMEALHGGLTRERAVYCLVDRGGLPWYEASPALSSDPYPVVVAGADGGALFVDDRDESPHALPEEEFAVAWARHKKGRHHRVTVRGPETAVDLPAAIRSALATTVAHLTGPVLGNSFDANFGFSGMARFAQQLRDGRTKSGWARRFAEPGAFAWALLRLHDCLEVEYTAPGATRPVYAEFLDEAAGVLDQPALGEAAAVLRESSRNWSRLADLAAETADGMGEVTSLAQRRMAIVMTEGAAGANEIAALSAEMAAQGSPGPDPALLDELADLVDNARALEQKAIALLTV
ncbi:MAG TPA: DUF4872 domain-containing protein [Candidatus Limnocylindrales bacterium]|nr:DUF4872 domain-containing protein [Candidatus Limnocylindrales bacterium]